MAALPGVTRAAIVLESGPRRGYSPRVLLTVLIVGVLFTPISAQTRPQAGTTAPTRQEQGGAPAPSAASLARIRRALALERTTDFPDAAYLSFIDTTSLVDERPSVELFRGFDFVGGVDLLAGTSGTGEPIPMGGPTHRDMLANMTPRALTEVASSDVLGLTTASAFAFVPAAIKTFAGWIMGGRGDDGPEFPILTAREETLAVAGIRADSQVLAADVDQRGRTVALSLVVPTDTPPGTARALGKRFLLLVKTIASAEPDPDDGVGAGDFDYIVRVGTPTETVLAVGGKATSDTRINW